MYVRSPIAHEPVKLLKFRHLMQTPYGPGQVIGLSKFLRHPVKVSSLFLRHPVCFLGAWVNFSWQHAQWARIANLLH